MQSFLADLRFGARMLRKSPGFTAIAVLALALGIGANTAIFSTVDAVLLRPLPFADPERLVMVWEDASWAGVPRNNMSPANWVDFRAQNQVFTDIAATRARSANLTGTGTPEALIGRGVTPNFFTVMGVQPALGRAFTEAEDRASANVVVIGYGLWQRRFGGDRSVIGRPIQMSGEAYTVIGVMPRSFSFPTRENEFWIPVRFTAGDMANRGFHVLTVVARLRPGITLDRARSDMSAISARLERAYPASNTRLRALVIPIREQLVGDTKIALIVLLAAAGCVLLIACFNIANLLLARATSRRREIAVRMALGAGRGRLVRQLFTESVLLAAMGGALGLFFAQLALKGLERFIPDALPEMAIALNAKVLFFTAAISLPAALLFGLAPALQAARLGFNDALKQGGRSGVGGPGKLFRHVLVTAEIALALVLLVSAGLMVQTLAQLRGLDAGFEPKNLLMLRSLPTPARYGDTARRVAFYDEVLRRVTALPGVQVAGFSSNLPFTSRGNTTGFRVEGHPATDNDVMYRVVTTDYPRTLGVRLIAGRLFDNRDREGSQPVVIINETFARQYWPDGSAVGKRIQAGMDAANLPLQTVIGVVGDVRERGLDVTMKPGVYVPVTQARGDVFVPAWLAVRTAVDPLSLAGAVRAAIWAVDREQPVASLRSMEQTMDMEVAGRSRQMFLLGAFAGLAVLLASLGIYGVLSYVVTQRTREIGLRMALGATPGQILRLVAGQGLRLIVVGVVLGTAGALAVTRAMRALLFGVAPTDPATYAAVSLLLAAVALAACYLPARRASRVDPMIALREE